MDHVIDKPDTTAATPVVSRAAKPARKSATTTIRRPVAPTTMPATFDALIGVGRYIDAVYAASGAMAALDAADGIVNRFRVAVPSSIRSVSVVDGRRIEITQNGIVTVTPPVSDLAFAAMNRIAFPGSPSVFVRGSWDDGIRIANGVRGEWTRDGHRDPSWRPTMTAPVAAPGPSRADARTWAARRAAFDAGVRAASDDSTRA